MSRSSRSADGDGSGGADDYEVIRELGRGSFGTASLARHRPTGALRVLKSVDLDALRGHAREQAIGELDLLSKLRHRHIVGYHGSFTDAQHLNLVLECECEEQANRLSVRRRTSTGERVHMEGIISIRASRHTSLSGPRTDADAGDLADAIVTAKASGRAFSETRILEWLAQLASALDYVHANRVIHRDLKTSNVLLLSQDGDWPIVKVADFGIARQMSRTASLASTTVGTPYYMSPEIINSDAYSFKADVWSLGCIAYELATLRRPFEASSMGGLVLRIMRGEYAPLGDSYSPAFRRLVASTLALDPAARPTMRDIADAPVVRAALARASARSRASRTSSAAADGAGGGGGDVDNGDPAPVRGAGDTDESQIVRVVRDSLFDAHGGDGGSPRPGAAEGAKGAGGDADDASGDWSEYAQSTALAFLGRGGGLTQAPPPPPPPPPLRAVPGAHVADAAAAAAADYAATPKAWVVEGAAWRGAGATAAGGTMGTLPLVEAAATAERRRRGVFNAGRWAADDSDAGSSGAALRKAVVAERAAAGMRAMARWPPAAKLPASAPQPADAAAVQPSAPVAGHGEHSGDGGDADHHSVLHDEMRVPLPPAGGGPRWQHRDAADTGAGGASQARAAAPTADSPHHAAAPSAASATAPAATAALSASAHLRLASPPSPRRRQAEGRRWAGSRASRHSRDSGGGAADSRGDAGADADAPHALASLHRGGSDAGDDAHFPVAGGGGSRASPVHWRGRESFAANASGGNDGVPAPGTRDGGGPGGGLGSRRASFAAEPVLPVLPINELTTRRWSAGGGGGGGGGGSSSSSADAVSGRTIGGAYATTPDSVPPATSTAADSARATAARVNVAVSARLSRLHVSRSSRGGHASEPAEFAVGGGTGGSSTPWASGRGRSATDGGTSAYTGTPASSSRDES